jgi:hypothetical protein
VNQVTPLRRTAQITATASTIAVTVSAGPLVRAGRCHSVMNWLVSDTRNGASTTSSPSGLTTTTTPAPIAVAARRSRSPRAAFLPSATATTASTPYPTPMNQKPWHSDHSQVSGISHHRGTRSCSERRHASMTTRSSTKLTSCGRAVSEPCPAATKSTVATAAGSAVARSRHTR